MRGDRNGGPLLVGVRYRSIETHGQGCSWWVSLQVAGSGSGKGWHTESPDFRSDLS